MLIVALFTIMYLLYPSYVDVELLFAQIFRKMVKIAYERFFSFMAINVNFSASLFYETIYFLSEPEQSSFLLHGF